MPKKKKNDFPNSLKSKRVPLKKLSPEIQEIPLTRADLVLEKDYTVNLDVRKYGKIPLFRPQEHPELSGMGEKEIRKHAETKLEEYSRAINGGNCRLICTSNGRMDFITGSITICGYSRGY